MPSPLKLQVNRASRTLKGTTSPGARIRVTNMSAAPVGPTRSRFVDEIVTADARGHFKAVVPVAQQGDQVRVEQVGTPKNWLTVRLDGISDKDTRRPEISLQGYRLTPSKTAGLLQFQCLRRVRQIGEPLAIVRLRNQRTKKFTDFKLDDKGCLPSQATIAGKLGDTFKVSHTDGAHDTRLRQGCGFITAIDPKALNDGDMPPLSASLDPTQVRRVHYKGPLFGQNIRHETPMQGATGNCWLVSIASALAALDPTSLKRLITAHQDGTYTVTFQRYDSISQAYCPEKVRVDGRL